MTLDEAAMCEPVSVGIHACRRASVQAGMKVAILGAGPIGLVTMLVAKAFGASQVVVTDLSEQRLDIARKLEAGFCLNVTGLSSSEVSQQIIERLGNRKPDVTMDCCGFASSMKIALKVAASGGKVCLIGMGQAEMNLPIVSAAAREVDIFGVFRYRNTYQLAINLISSKKIDIKPLVTDKLSLVDGFCIEKIKEGFRKAETSKGSIKVMFGLLEEGEK
eukprot:CAMPEP_0171459648 /NCGR_PEP_ID=MMETSP0945-20130129/4846_1 /TAXON_ID=109269 /ORGANISM="Vaucheria litorea, Strain CCMP2940" /LENGTH=218 /DNA_ID=CAMNT_0011985705 /DNA_START=437 /DNA_END=1093 /DNA_ORIENTATION=-